jgi:hypothetical protein
MAGGRLVSGIFATNGFAHRPWSVALNPAGFETLFAVTVDNNATTC